MDFWSTLEIIHKKLFKNTLVKVFPSINKEYLLKAFESLNVCEDVFSQEKAFITEVCLGLLIWKKGDAPLKPLLPVLVHVII